MTSARVHRLSTGETRPLDAGGRRERAATRVVPARQPNHKTASPMAQRTTAMVTSDSVVKRLSVPLDRPVKASPTTGKTGTPQPASVHGPVVSPSTLVTAPAMPARRAAVEGTPQASPSRRLYAQSAK